ncbi:general substrate transporter [Xylariaceae sp. FL1019]|nr:general substrate transporter [Xylariaceae sp. FL1019]
MAGGVVIQGTTDVTRVEAPVTFKAYLICAFAAFGGIFFGYDTGWMSGVLAEPYFISLYTGYDYNYDTGMSPNFGPSDDEQGKFSIDAPTSSLFTSILSLGTFLGSLVGADIADNIGRRPTIIGGCLVFIIGCILEIASTNQEVLFVFGRLIAGLGVGFISAVVILYMSEISPRKIRGALVSGYQFCITVGILLANVVVYTSQARPDTGSYRIPIGVQFLWALVLGTGLLFLPESPRYFVKKGKIEEAAKALAFCRGQPIESDYIKDELAEVVANNEFELAHIPQQSYIGSWLACFKGSLSNGASPLRRTLLGTGLQAAQQLTGINFIFYFGPQFLTSLHTIDNVFLIQLITTLVNVLSTPISFYTIEKFGRRKLLICGGAAMVFCQYLIAILGVTAARPGNGNDAAVKAQIAFIAINIAFFASTWGPSAWVVVGEIFPLPIRARGVGLSTASNWLWNTIIAVITPYLVSETKANLQSKVFFLWGSTAVFSTLFAYFLVPELKGLSLEQADMCMSAVSPRKSASWRPDHTFAAEMHHVAGDEKTPGEVTKEEV